MPKIKRVETRSYTTVDNTYLRDIGLGLVERGLLTTMLSLPDNWEFSGRGLAAILPDGKDRIFNSLRKLEERGYLKRSKITVKGKIVDYLYEFCDSPIFLGTKSQNNGKEKGQKNNFNKVHFDVPYSDKPDTTFTDNNKYTNKSDANSEKSQIFQTRLTAVDSLSVSNNNRCETTSKPVDCVDEPSDGLISPESESTCNLKSCNKKLDSESVDSSISIVDANDMANSKENDYIKEYIAEPTCKELAAIYNEDEMREFVKKRVVIYDFCIKRLGFNNKDIDFVVDTIVEMLLNRKKQWIGGRYIGIREIRTAITKLNAERVAYILTKVNKKKGGIGNYRQYLKAAILNSSDPIIEEIELDDFVSNNKHSKKVTNYLETDEDYLWDFNSVYETEWDEENKLDGYFCGQSTD